MTSVAIALSGAFSGLSRLKKGRWDEGLGFRGLGFRGLGFRGLGFRV